MKEINEITERYNRMYTATIYGSVEGARHQKECDFERLVYLVEKMSSCETFKDEGKATLTEYATELISMQEKPQDSNKEWKITVIQNTIGKLYETLENL